jgi:hypothetical protein
MNYLKEIIFVISIFTFSTILNAQSFGVSGGLAFSSSVDYKVPDTDFFGSTGNPGIFAKAFLKFNKRFYFIPAAVFFSAYKDTDINSYDFKAYMFQGDVDLGYGFYKDKYLKVIGFTGLNGTAISQKWDIFQTTAFTDKVKNSIDFQPGVNFGGALQLFVNDSFDGYISAKYIVGNYSQVIINIGGIYYLGSRPRKGSW